MNSPHTSHPHISPVAPLSHLHPALQPPSPSMSQPPFVHPHHNDLASSVHHPSSALPGHSPHFNHPSSDVTQHFQIPVSSSPHSAFPPPGSQLSHIPHSNAAMRYNTSDDPTNLNASSQAHSHFPDTPTADVTSGVIYGPPEGALATSYVGSYTLYGTIGEGAFGKVKIAVDRRTNIRVAIKIMDKGQIRAQEFTAQVRREIYIMRCLKHRHIVRMNEVLTSDTKLYIVMELVTGGELFERIEKGRVSEDTARKYFQQLVDGVDFCHKKGVAHRDLKPENLLLDENGDIKITDFGFSSMKGMDVNTGLLYTQCGTPDYCAPEIIDSAQNGYTGAKVDAWSCGIILYALLCGRLPFQEPDTDKLYDLILACQVKYPPFITPGARDLLENLLVRDPAKRYDLQKVKRHPWFLVNYEGDDAKLIKKRPFFNKNQKDLTGSTPSSPMIPSSKDPLSTSSTSSNNASTPTPHTPGYSQQSIEHRKSPAPPTSYVQTDQHSREPEPSAVAYHHNSSLPSQNTSSQSPHINSQPQLMDAGTPRNIHSGSSVAASRMRDDPYAAFRPTSPATDPSMHVRVPTPPAQEVFTKVEDRPATPARRQTSASTAAAFQAAVNAAAMHANEAPSGATTATQPPYSTGLSGGSRLSPTPTSSSAPPLSNGVPSSLDSSGFPSISESAARNDDSSSEPDSVEDYENKPAPLLEMPPNPRQVFRSNKDGRRQILSLPVSQQPRQRSDLTGTTFCASPHPLSAGNELASTSLSAIQRPRRVYGRDSANTGSVGDPRSLRITRSDAPSSPPVVYSPSPVSSSFERFRSVSPGFGNMRPASMQEEVVPNGGTYGHTSGSTHMPWQSSSSVGYGSARDDGAVYPTSGTWQSEVLARHLWNMTNKLRGTSDPANPKLSKELRKEYNFIAHEVRQLGKLEDVAQIVYNFLSLFEIHGLSDVPAGSPIFGPPHSLDDEFETNDADHGHTNGDVRFPGLRPNGTDISSEEEPLSLSPVVAETNGPQLSDLARRRNLSDLLSKWIKTTDQHRPEECSGEAGDSGQNLDLNELQRLMREHQGGREESNLAEELLRLMNGPDDGNNSSLSAGASQPGHSPPPPHVQTTRSHDSYTQSRYLSGIPTNSGMGRPPNPVRTPSNNTAALPQDYVPGRFKEPNSMPLRGRNGNDRQTGLSGRTDVRPNGEDLNGNSGRERDAPSHMANSMGMHDVPYYMSDKRGGMANKLRGVLQTMKAKNHRLGEHHAQFRSRMPPDEILRLLARVLQDMGGKVTVKKETKRKMKCQLELKPNCMLHAGIELVAMEDGYTCVAFRRSKADRGKTDTESFHSFFERVRSRFIDEANAVYPSLKMTTSNAASRRRRNNRDEGVRHATDMGQTSLLGN